MTAKKRIILGITGSIAAIKVFDLIEQFEKENFEIKLIATEASRLFILSALARRPWKIFRLLAVWETGLKEVIGYFSRKKGKVRHINLVKWTDAIVIAPATMKTIGKIATANDEKSFLVTVTLAMPENKKVFIAPAMNTEMWNNPLFQKNLKELRDLPERYGIIEPVLGKLQCGDEGMGKMEDVKEIVRIVAEKLLKRGG